MIQSSVPTPEASNFISLLPSTRRSQRQLLNVFGAIALSLFLYELYLAQNSPLETRFAALLMTGAALLPSYLWCSGKALGMPVFPLFAITFVWTYALPLISNNPSVMDYSPANQLFAGFTVTGFLIVGTVGWFQFVKSSPTPPRRYRSLSNQKGTNFFFLALATSTLFNVLNNAGMLASVSGIFSIIRGIVVGLVALAAFVLSYRLGIRALSKRQTTLLVVLLIAYMVSNAIGFLLVGAASVFVIAAIAYIIGRKKIPFLTIAIVMTILTFLHPGKGDMRAKYWGDLGQPFIVQPWDYPAIYAEWIGHSSENFNKPADDQKTEKKQSFLERSSVIQMLLLAQTESPEKVPFLYGESYSILPQLIVPRIFNANKIRSHEGTYILNVHYGRQTYEEALKTTIGWGLVAEAYANFGVLGLGGLGVILGLFYGYFTRWSINTPILSARSLFTILLMTFAFQTEWSAGVYVAALAQSSAVLVGIAIAFMRTYHRWNVLA